MTSFSRSHFFNKDFFKGGALSLVVFSLLVTLLAAYSLFPQVNALLEKQHIRDSRITLEIEAELFERFVDQYHDALVNLSEFPVVINAALLSQGNHPDLIDLVDNFSISERKGEIILHDIGHNVIYQTQGLQGHNHFRKAWIDDLLEGRKPYHFELLEEHDNQSRFILSVPIKYNGNIEGIISAEEVLPMDQIFSPEQFNSGAAFRLSQGDRVVQTSSDQFLLPQEISTQIPLKDVTLTYIFDESEISDIRNQFKNRILTILLMGFGASFILFTLIGYGALSEREKEEKDKSIAVQAYFLPVIVFLIGVGASISAYLFVYTTQEQEVERRITVDVFSEMNRLEQRLGQYNKILNLLQSFYSASTNVSRDEFHIFTRNTLNDYASIQALEWVPMIPADRRDHYEKNAKFEGADKGIITQRNEQGQLIPAAQRDVYFPVDYVAPMAGNEVVLGFDLGSSPVRMQAMEKAALRGVPTATAPIALLQGQEKQIGVLIFNPIYNENKINNASLSPMQQLEGFVVLVLQVENVIEDAAFYNSQNMNLMIEDVTKLTDPLTVYTRGDVQVTNNDYTQNKLFSMAGRNWALTFTPKMEYYKSNEALLTKIVLVGGLAFTFFITYTLIQLIHRRRTIEKKVERRTKEVRKLSAAMENAVEGVSEIDTKGRYTYLNEAYAGTCGYQAAELVGKDWAVTVMPEDHDMMQQAYQYMLEHGRVVAEPRGIRKDGSVFFKRVTMISKYDEEGELEGHHCFMNDISERKEQEAQKAQLTEELMRSNEELARFAYVASHDLQEPLRMVGSFTNLLQKRYGDSLDDTAQEYIKFAADGARRMHVLVEDLLEYSKITQDTDRYELVDLQNTIMPIVLDNLREGIEASNAQITFENLPIMTTNPIRFTRLLQNIIGNAVKYQAEGQQPVIDIRAKRKDGDWLLTVTDNGIGMKQEYCEQIFEPFNRLHGKHEYNGTGMGLAITRKIVEGFGGKIWVKSKPGKGSVFHIQLPELLVNDQDEQKDINDDD